MTSKDVYHNLEDTIFYLKKKNLVFYFSSEFNTRRFNKLYKEYLREQTARIRNKYHVNLVIDEYLLVALYKKIEKRGFRVLREVKEKDTIHIEKLSEYDIFTIRK